MLVLDVDDVLDRPVRRVTRYLVGPDLPAEADSPEHVQERLILHGVGRGDQDPEDDAGLPTIDGVVVVADLVTILGLLLTLADVLRRGGVPAGRAYGGLDFGPFGAGGRTGHR